MKNPVPIPITRKHTPLFDVAQGVTGLQVMMVNVYFISYGDETGRPWFLVDAGLGQCAKRIRKAAETLFGKHTRPAGILLTHGHFDHIGALSDLLKIWFVPIYAHPLELPYLTGRSAYPPPDPTVGGGALALMAGLYPKKPINLGERVQPFPADGTIPGLPGWQVLHTPGHTPGHVSFYRESDGTLLAGDAITTVKQASLSAVLSQKKEIHGPPAYYTSDWQAAQQSVSQLAALQPTVVASGHGQPMQGESLPAKLSALSRHFQEWAVPKHGRYVDQPARADENGVVDIPPPLSDPLYNFRTILLVALGGIALALLGKKMADEKKVKNKGKGKAKKKKPFSKWR